MSLPSFAPVYVNATLPSAPLLQSAGAQVPVAPAFAPVTANETRTPASAAALSSFTVAVTVCFVPTGLVAVAGSSASVGGVVTVVHVLLAVAV